MRRVNARTPGRDWAFGPGYSDARGQRERHLIMSAEHSDRAFMAWYKVGKAGAGGEPRDSISDEVIYGCQNPSRRKAGKPADGRR